MPTAVQVLAVARSQLGTKEAPIGSNHTKYGVWYGLDREPWCAMFISWLAAHTRPSATTIIPRHAYTPAGAAWFKKHGRWGHTPRPGAIVYFKFPSMGRISHVGIVEAVHSDGSVTTIEGNTNTSGSRSGIGVFRLRRRSNIAGYGYPAYAPSGAAAPRPAIPAPRPAAPAPRPAAALMPVYWSRLRYGQRDSDSVRALQRRLNAVLGGSDIHVNGHYSKVTKAKVAEFQRRQGWRGSDADGLIYPGGRETTKRLFAPGSGYRIIWG